MRKNGTGVVGWKGVDRLFKMLVESVMWHLSRDLLLVVPEAWYREYIDDGQVDFL